MIQGVTPSVGFVFDELAQIGIKPHAIYVRYQPATVGVIVDDALDMAIHRLAGKIYIETGYGLIVNETSMPEYQLIASHRSKNLRFRKKLNPNTISLTPSYGGDGSILWINTWQKDKSRIAELSELLRERGVDLYRHLRIAV